MYFYFSQYSLSADPESIERNDVHPHILADSRDKHLYRLPLSAYDELSSAGKGVDIMSAVGHGAFTSTGAILVLFILLVIISRAFIY